ncbi:hypothetical protein HDU85_001243, partial [Gaertneriomyces sp. JEL0708]
MSDNPLEPSSTGSTVKLWSLFDTNISRCFIWPLLTIEDGLTASTVNRATSVDRKDWKTAKPSYPIWKQLLEYKPSKPNEYHVPRSRIHRLHMFQHQQDPDEMWPLFRSVVDSLVYLTELKLDCYGKDIALFDGWAQAGGPISRLPALKWLRLEHWAHMVEA